MDRLERRFLRLQGLHDDPISSDEDDAPSESLDMLESRLRQMQRRTALNRERSRAATRLQSRYRGNRIRTLKRRNRETLDRMRRNVEQMKSDPYMDEARSRFFAPESSIIHQNTRHGDITDLIVPYLAIEHRKRELSRLIDEFNYKYRGQPGVRASTTLQDGHDRDMILLPFDVFIRRYLFISRLIQRIIISSSKRLNLDKEVWERNDSSEEDEFQDDDEINTFAIYIQEIISNNKIEELTDEIVDELIREGFSKTLAYRYTSDFVRFLINP